MRGYHLGAFAPRRVAAALRLLGIASCFFALPAAAQNDDTQSTQDLDVRDLSALSLEQLLSIPVVTASGRAEERSLAAANVFIVTRGQIERRGYRSLAEVLRQVPGLYLVYDYAGYSVGVREITAGYRGGTRLLKVMIDGFPVSFRPDLDAFLGPEFLPMEAIERVEVAKGPLSALYGANAFVATVNVITRRPEKAEPSVAGRYMVVNGNAGWGGSALVARGDKEKGFLLSVSTDRIDRSGVGVDRTYEAQSPDDPVFQRASAGDLAKPVSAFGRLDYRSPRAGSFSLSFGHQELDVGAEFQLNSVLTHRSRIALFNQWSALNWEHKLGEHSRARAYVGASRGGETDDYILFLTTGGTNSAYKPHLGYRALNALAEVGHQFGPSFGFDLGFDTELRSETPLYYSKVFFRPDGGQDPLDEVDQIAPEDPRSIGFTQFGSYLQLYSAPIHDVPDFRVTAALRGDWTEFGPVSYPLETSLKGAIAYRFSSALTLKMIGGRAFQTPSGTLLLAHSGFGNERNVVGSERLLNPRSIRPQVINSVELVASAQPTEFMTLEASAYYQDLTDVIRFYEAGSIIVAKNSGREASVGAELVANLQLGRAKPYVVLAASRQVSAELSRDLAGLTSFDGSPSLYPRLFGYAGIDFELIEALLFLNAELRGATPRGASQGNFYRNDTSVYDLKAYLELDMTLSTGKFALLHRDVGTEALLSVRNLTNTRRIEPGFAGVDIRQPATSLFLQIKQHL